MRPISSQRSCHHCVRIAPIFSRREREGAKPSLAQACGSHGRAGARSPAPFVPALNMSAERINSARPDQQHPVLLSTGWHGHAIGLKVTLGTSAGCPAASSPHAEALSPLPALFAGPGCSHKIITASRPRHAWRACWLGKNLRGNKRPAWPYYIFLLHCNKKVLAKEMPLPILRFVAVQHFTVEV